MAAEDPDGASRARRVTRTGIALVHEGEVVLPAAGSEAQSEAVVDDSRAVVQYIFPVYVEVRASPDGMKKDDLIDAALDRLTQGLEGV